MQLRHPRLSAQCSPGEPRVWLVDHPGSGAPEYPVLQGFCAAMQRGLDGVFAPALNRSALFQYGDAADVSPGDLVLGLFRDPDQPGALGYHDPAGIGKVFPVLDAQDGADLSQTIDHELKEMLEDLLCDNSKQSPDGRFWADECCDAVEQDAFQIDGVPLSNFVLPSWYSGDGSRWGGRYDYLGKLTAPLTVTAGGYCQWFDPASGWQQIVSDELAPRSYRLADFGRSRRRAVRAAVLASMTKGIAP